MSYEYDTKGVLLEWMKEGDNKLCAECAVPHPQWCSLSLGISLCLSCSGTHRSLGSHLSFVRSLTMDKWTPPQIERMKAGGNAKAREFFEGNGQPWKSLPIQEKYTTHVATMYREKLLADAEGRPWVPSSPPQPSSASPAPGGASSLSSSSGSLRKPRTGGSSASSLRGASPASTPRGGSPASSTQKAQNEDFFARMGAQNDSRPDHLPPSQGGKYQGFGGGGPVGSSAGGNASNPLSSRNLPRFDDLRDDPAGALSKGWGFLGAALGAVGKTVNESVIQPGLERAHDPALQSQLSSFSTKAFTTLSTAARAGGQVLSTGLESGSTFLRRDLGVDVGDLGASYVDRATGRGAGEGYGRVGEEHAPGGHSHLEPGRGTLDGEGDFFSEHLAPASGENRGGYCDMPTLQRAPSASTSAASRVATPLDPPPAPAPAAPTGSWDDLAPQAAARRAQQEKERAEKDKAQPAKKPAEEDEWESW
ncbi:hypothetical protein Rhopal_005100-T1 [Rhodotorula paludigena]|uniref:Arf-GAP domain-containing protein n=1 Tax=Rhodotorula paludigena TaxID=86838 RepID=A0AAV5GRH4_9BASI|nr:hypothetical protein Rhopal_005100-T1 [Rhodotorula paludigena]